MKMLYQVLCAALLLILGTVSALPHGRIVNGNTADIENYPFLVSLRYLGTHTCGATILTPRWLMTAAHCIDGVYAEQLSVQYGEATLKYWSDNVVYVKRIVKHREYNAYDSYANDIALIELATDLVYDEANLTAVTLPARGFEIPQVEQGAVGVLAGWGAEKAYGDMQNELQEVELKIYSDADCKRRVFGESTVHQICGGVDVGGKGQCSGDSGGPLLYEGSIQLGIVSWSIKPCGAYPGVYTKVSHYIDWIEQNVDDASLLA